MQHRKSGQLGKIMKKFLWIFFLAMAAYFLSLPVSAYLWEKQAKTYAEESLADFAVPWSQVNLHKRLSQDAAKASDDDDRKLVQSMDEALGSFSRVEDSKCQLQRHVGWTSTSNTFAACILKSVFEKGDAEVGMMLILERGGWKVFSLQIESAAGQSEGVK